MKKFLHILVFFISIALFSQNKTKAELKTMEDEELLSYFNEVDTDSLHAEIVARVYLDRGRMMKDTIMMARGYDRLARIYNPEKNIQFADSVIALTKDMKHISYPALGYMIKAYNYSILQNLPEYTKNTYLLYDYATENENVSHQLYSLHYLIISKSFWGNNKESLELQKYRNKILQQFDIIEQIKKSSRKSYQYKTNEILKEFRINSFQTYITCYVNIKEYDKAEIYLDSMKTLVNSYNDLYYLDYKGNLVLSEMELHYSRKNYEKVFQLAENTMLAPNYKNGDYWFDVNNFVGLSYIKMGQTEKGICFLKRADSIYTTTQKELVPYQRKVFETLLTYYKSKNDIPNQLDMYSKLAHIDSIFQENYKFFEPDMIRKFETPRLLKEKEAMIAGLSQKNKKSTAYILGILGILLFAIFGLLYYFNRQRIYKKRFTALLQENKSYQGIIHLSKPKEVKPELSEETITDILEKLERFERKKQYLIMDVTLTGLSKLFNTNANYLSRIINLKMEKGFSQYLNDLRIEYALSELKDNPKFRKYSIKAIATDCGFSSAESFSRAFYKSTGIYPSYYLKKMGQEASGF